MMSTMEEEPPHKVRKDLEEGELSDSDGEVDYTPLARPDNLVHFNPVSIMSMNIRDDASSESEQEPSSEEDSDSDNPSSLVRAKKPKIKIKKRQRSGSMQSNKMDKYKIWCKTAGEDTLSENLVGCDVALARNKVDYGVESYTRIPRDTDDDYNQFNGKHRGENHDTDKEMSECHQNNSYNSRKRSYKNRNDGKLCRNRRFSKDSDHEKGEVRFIQDLSVDLNSCDEDIANDVAEKLNECKTDLILRMVKILGKEKMFELFKHTKRIEGAGGMRIMNGRRRRTPGGVLIFLLKRDHGISEDKMKEVFEEDVKCTKMTKRKRDLEVRQLKQSLTDGGLPALLTRAEQWAAKNLEAPSDSNHVSNPPPSPVTDGRDCSSDADPNHFSSQAAECDIDDDTERRNDAPPEVIVNNLPLDPRAALQSSYEDDCIDITCNDDMELF